MTRIRDGSRGIDCNRQLFPWTLATLANQGFEFVNRYLSRAEQPNAYDLHRVEAGTIRRMGLALGFVQHCPPGLWTPSPITSVKDARFAVEQLRAMVVPLGKTVWYDAEMIDTTTAAPSLILESINAWATVIDESGYQSGAYVGYECGLTPKELYYGLRVTRYWAGYNLDRDKYPAVRGVCMHQHPAPAGMGWADIDTVNLDALGCLPSFWEVDE